MAMEMAMVVMVAMWYTDFCEKHGCEIDGKLYTLALGMKVATTANMNFPGLP